MSSKSNILTRTAVKVSCIQKVRLPQQLSRAVVAGSREGGDKIVVVILHIIGGSPAVGIRTSEATTAKAAVTVATAETTVNIFPKGHGAKSVSSRVRKCGTDCRKDYCNHA